MQTTKKEDKEFFTVISEGREKISKVISLAHSVFFQMDILFKNEGCASDLVIVGYNKYEYITEKQYKDILTELTKDGTFDFSSSGLPNTIVESSELMSVVKNRAHKISTTTTIPLLSYSMGKAFNTESW